MIMLDQIHVDIYIDPKISDMSRRILMREVEQEVRTAVAEAEYTLRQSINEKDQSKFRIKVTKL